MYLLITFPYMVCTDMSVIFHYFSPICFFCDFSSDYLLQVSFRWEWGVWAALQSDITIFNDKPLFCLPKLWDNTSSITDTVIENCLIVRYLTPANGFLKDIPHQQYISLLYYRSQMLAPRSSPRQHANSSNLRTDYLLISRYHLAHLLILLWADVPNRRTFWLMKGLFARSKSKKKKSA